MICGPWGWIRTDTLADVLSTETLENDSSFWRMDQIKVSCKGKSVTGYLVRTKYVRGPVSAHRSGCAFEERRLCGVVGRFWLSTRGAAAHEHWTVLLRALAGTIGSMTRVCRAYSYNTAVSHSGQCVKAM